MRIFIIGGNGRTGKLIVDEALKRGHTVTALVRKVESLVPREGLTIVKGTPTLEADVAAAFAATPQDPPGAVISALNAARASDNPWSANLSPPRMMADSAAACVSIMNHYNIRKIAIMSALGVGDSLPNLIFIMRWILNHSNMGAQYEDHNIVDTEVKRSGLDYVLVRPCRLTEADALPVKVWGNTGAGAGGMASVSRKSVATFMLDAVEKSEWDGTTPVISN